MLVSCSQWWSRGVLQGPAIFRFENDVLRQRLDPSQSVADLHVQVLLPGLTDLQVNGGGGVMFNNDPTVEGLRRIVAAHRNLGTNEILPTIISDTPAVMEAAAEAALTCRNDRGMLGLHIEGPHFALERRGTHAAEHIRPLDTRTVELVEHLRQAGMRVMVTLAPEVSETALLARLVNSGAIVSGGHSSATAQQTRYALERGLSCFTHLFNGMPPMTSRAPGIVGAAICSRAAVGVIVDGIHVDWDMLRIALRARPPGAWNFAVSDAMATVGGPNAFRLYGREIRLSDGVLLNDEGNLAGAHLDMVTSLRNLVRHVGLSLQEAIAMCSDVPRAVLGLAHHDIGPGTHVIDLLALDDQLFPVPLR